VALLDLPADGEIDVPVKVYDMDTETMREAHEA